MSPNPGPGWNATPLPVPQDLWDTAPPFRWHIQSTDPVAAIYSKTTLKIRSVSSTGN